MKSLNECAFKFAIITYSIPCQPLQALTHIAKILVNLKYICFCRGSHLGVPGWPGTPDLDSCLRRLGPGDRSGTPSQFLPYGCRTPDSIMSTG